MHLRSSRARFSAVRSCRLHLMASTVKACFLTTSLTSMVLPSRSCSLPHIKTRESGEVGEGGVGNFAYISLLMEAES